MKFRPYKPADAETILSWVKDEETFRKWVTDRYPHYPISPAEMNEKYFDHNGDCPEPDNFYPMTACDDTGLLGHMILRFTAPETIRFGFVIVDDSRRGAGIGKRMLQMAIRYAADFLKAKRITIGVLDNNPGALRCYLGVGFREAPQSEPVYYDLLGQHIRCIELEMDV